MTDTLFGRKVKQLCNGCYIWVEAATPDVPSVCKRCGTVNVTDHEHALHPFANHLQCSICSRFFEESS